MGPLPPPSTDKGSCLLSCGFFPPPRALRGFSHTRCGIVTPLGAKREADKQAWSHLLSGLKRAPSYLSSQLSHPPRSLGAHRGPTGGPRSQGSALQRQQLGSTVKTQSLLETRSPGWLSGYVFVFILFIYFKFCQTLCRLLKVSDLFIFLCANDTFVIFYFNTIVSQYNLGGFNPIFCV